MKVSIAWRTHSFPPSQLLLHSPFWRNGLSIIDLSCLLTISDSSLLELLKLYCVIVTNFLCMIIWESFHFTGGTSHQVRRFRLCYSLKVCFVISVISMSITYELTKHHPVNFQWPWKAGDQHNQNNWDSSWKSKNGGTMWGILSLCRRSQEIGLWWGMPPITTLSNLFVCFYFISGLPNVNVDILNR